MIRPAERDDLYALVRLEAAFPEGDRFDQPTWRRLMAGNARIFVSEEEDVLNGAAVVLFRKGTSIARLYSITVAPEARGRGVARMLLSSAEATAVKRRCRGMRLEVRSSNSQAIRLYDQAGYRVLQRVENYYPDGEAAIRMEKTLVPHPQGLS